MKQLLLRYSSLADLPPETRADIIREIAVEACKRDLWNLEAKAQGVLVRAAKLTAPPAQCTGVALWCLPAHWAPRRLVFTIVTHPVFDAIVYSAIVISCLFLAMDNPGVDGNSTLRHVLDTGDVVFATCFVTEMVLKLVAMGAWWCGPG